MINWLQTTHLDFQPKTVYQTVFTFLVKYHDVYSEQLHELIFNWKPWLLKLSLMGIMNLIDL